MRKMTLVVILGFGLMFFGCNKAAEKTSETDAHSHTEVSTSHGTDHEVDGWCVEHELPEKVCSLCNSKVAAEFQKNGDWCKEHNRAESQCFLCDPSRKEKFVAQYEAQYGKKPPK
ncbi:MAG: hypothetical protein LBC20_04450 [Planctomycetaceae bacterium]|jgi:hypothetical protein|nr:hypothetical protein [Planctomycetaceae bacterium]